jgi:glycosyltransferase 2 family protein
VRLSRREPPLSGEQEAVSAGAAVPVAPVLVPAVQVEDDLLPRVRMPADLLRCILTGIELVLVAIIGLVGVQVSAAGATRRLAAPVLGILGFLAHFAIFVLPLALAVRLAARRQWRRLAEAVVTAGVVIVFVALANVVLRQPAFSLLYDGLAAAPRADGMRPALFDSYLAGVVAYITVIGLAGRPQWRAAFWVSIGFYSLTSLADAQTTVLALLITLLIGSSIGSGLRFAVGTVSERPSALQIARALSAANMPVAKISRVWDARSENREYRVVTADGKHRDVMVFDRDQQAADVLYRIYRRVRLKDQISRSAPLTVERAVERHALLIYAVEDAGVATPTLRALLRVGSEAAVLACDRMTGTALADLPEPPSDEQLRNVWSTVLRLHEHSVTHRTLTADRILLTGPDLTDVVLLDPGNGDVAASEIQLRLDLSQLLAELALLVGPARAADLATDQVGHELPGLVPLLQPVALHRSTRAELRRRKDILPALRKRLSASAPDGEAPPPVRLERFRLRTILTLVIGVVAADILVGQLSKEKFGDLIDHVHWGWSVVALALSLATYIGATWSLSGFVLERLHFVRTFLAQLAGSFVTLVTPAAVGGVALNLRFLRKSGVAPADAAASVGVSQVFAFTLHLLLLITFAALTGTSQRHSLRPPGWVYLTLAALVAAALVVLAFPAGRRIARQRLAPALGQVIPRLLDVAQRPGKLTEGIGGALLLTSAYILCLDASIRALGGSVPLASIAVVYLAGNAIGSVVPTPGGLGAVEAALSAGLTAAGLPGTTAVSAVLLFRTLTFWLPVPLGWASMNYLIRRDAL